MTLQTIPVPAGLQTRYFILERGALSSLPELLNTAFPGKQPWLIADKNTWAVAGEETAKILTAAGISCHTPHIFPGTPRLHPNYGYSVQLACKMPQNCVPVAIGSGVINDLVKCASGIKEVPYCCVPTACSVDGYTSAGAALSVDGFKKTVKCPAPFAVCADVDILATAPPDMLASGYADLLTKIPAGADWIIADTLGIEPIRQDVWELIQHPIRGWVADHQDMLNIFHGLAATGYSMQMYIDSRPASGAEHMFSHIWEMEGLQKDGEEISHGFKVGIGLIATTILMEYIIKHDIEDLKEKMVPGLPPEERLEEVQTLLVRGCYGDGPQQTAMSKFLYGDALAERRALIISKWKTLQERLAGQLYSFETVRKMLKDANCPTCPAEIGLDEAQFLHGIHTAQLIRNRYTILDLLYEMGLMEDALLELRKMM